VNRTKETYARTEPATALPSTGEGTTVFSVASIDLPPTAESVPAARQLVGTVTGHLPRRAREAAELITSELVTNSVVHAGTPLTVFAAADEESVELVVSDGTGWTTADDKGTGHGLLLVGLLAAEWAAEMETNGKRVWARLEVDDVPAY
jgi:two-component sensor histidine kinase